MSVHWGTGKLIEKSQIPQWRGKPPGKGPFERAACGAFVKPDKLPVSPQKVTCQSCRRTRAWVSSCDDTHQVRTQS